MDMGKSLVWSDSKRKKNFHLYRKETTNSRFVIVNFFYIQKKKKKMKEKKRKKKKKTPGDTDVKRKERT